MVNSGDGVVEVELRFRRVLIRVTCSSLVRSLDFDFSEDKLFIDNLLDRFSSFESFNCKVHPSEFYAGIEQVKC